MERSHTYLGTYALGLRGAKPEDLLEAIEKARDLMKTTRFSIKFRGRNKNRKQFYDTHGYWRKYRLAKKHSLRQDLPLECSTHADVYVYVTGDVKPKDIRTVTKMVQRNILWFHEMINTSL